MRQASLSDFCVTDHFLIPYRTLFRRRILRALGLVFFIYSLLGCHSVDRSSTVKADKNDHQKPNIIVIVADQLRLQSVGYHGDALAKTPNIDKLATESVNFSQFVTNTPVCSTFRANLLTGKYASTTGMVINELRLNPNQDTFAHVLSQAGYRTSMLGKWHLWANQAGKHELPRNAYVPPGPYRMGFDDYWAAYNFNHNNYKAWYFQDSPQPVHIEGYGPDHFTDKAIDFIQTRAENRDQPFALFIGYSPPHPPWTTDNVPAEWLQKFSDVTFPLPENWSDHPDPRADRFKDPEWYRTNVVEKYQEIARVYYAMTANLDWNIGRLLAQLKKSGVAENTIVVLTSDHGEQLGSHGRIQKMIFFEESCRVPMLVRWPQKIPTGRESQTLISTVDLMPTLLRAMELNPPPQAEGKNLSAHLLTPEKADNPKKDYVFMQGMGHTFQWKNGYEWRAIRDSTYTYGKYLADGHEVLYNHRRDPQQLHNLAEQPQYKETLALFRQRLADKLAETSDPFKPATWYRERWTENRVIIRGAKGEFKRDLGPTVHIDVHASGI